MEFENASKNKEAIIKCLGRLVDAGKLHKLSKGKYYKPIKGDHNSIGPDSNEIIKDLLVKNGQPIGYITGFNVFNKSVIEASISNTIQIGRNTFKPTLYSTFSVAGGFPPSKFSLTIIGTNPKNTTFLRR